MSDEGKSRQELLQELKELRERISSLEASETEHRRTEEALTESEKRYRTLFENAGDAILILDVDESPGKIVAANKAASVMHGYEDEDIIGLNIQELDAPDAAKHVPRRIRKIMEGEWVKFEINHRRKDGTIFPVEVSAGPLELSGRNYIIAFDRDISERKEAEEHIQRYQDHLEELVKNRTTKLTETNKRFRQEITQRKKTEEALRQSERRYQALAELSPVGIYYADSNGDCVYVNERWCSIAGMEQEKAFGRGWTSVLHPDDRERVSALWDDAIAKGVPFKSEFRFLGPMGNAVWVLGQAAAQYDEEGAVTGYVGTITDITERKQTETAERLAALGVVAARVAHDLRNPLVSIGGFAKRLERSLSGRLKEEANIITKEAARLESKLRDILGFARERRFEEASVDIHALFMEVLELYEEELQQSNIELFMDFGEDIHLMGDPGSLREVFTNLITNAMQAIGSEGRITLKTELYSTETLIIISDTGQGIREEDIHLIFNPFFTTKIDGTGLGLSIVQRIVHEHCGTIEVQSKVGSGTNFILNLPLKRGES